MKKKIEPKHPQHYLTDALITSDEWDSFDYKLQLEIKELGTVDYDSQDINWKKNTLAFGYLYHVEKLLIEKYQWVDHEIEDIRELQTFIEKYNGLKTFLLTLRVATIAYRAGFIPKLVTVGAARLKYGEQQSIDRIGKPRGHGGLNPAEIQTRNKQIVEHFKKALLKNSSLKPSRFADKHAAEHKVSPRTIRLILSKAVGN